MKKLIASLLFLISAMAASAQAEVLIDAAKEIDSEGNNIVFIVVLLVVIIVVEFSVIVYLYKRTQELNDYIRSISEKAIISVSGMQSVLDNINATHINNYNKIISDHDKIHDCLTQLKYKNESKNE